MVGKILDINLIVVISLILLFSYLKLFNQKHNIKTYSLLHPTFLFVISFVISYVVIKHRWSMFYVPFCALSMLSIILFNELNISLLLTLALALSVAAVANGDFYIGLFFLVNGILSVILTQGVRKRIAIIRAGFIIGIIQTIILILGRGVFAKEFIGKFLFSVYILPFINGIGSSIVVVGVLPIFEYLFRKVTNISLLELADFNHPLLQRLVLEAPGTYHHSLVVGNLSEAACNAIGAHALLARIGAYYHDIGKLSKPEYFSENQTLEENKHDSLSPSMSKMIIMNHVRDGVDLAKKYRLNTGLIDFITQHHGTSLVYYFYLRALENLEEDQRIKEEGFRYPGPKPNTRETAVVLLADSVEAAVRALKDPTPARISEVVHKVINNKFIDGQLDECDLTLKDLEKISEVFTRILSGIYHSRVAYPENYKQALR
ncbi:MAG: HDIG domain-containing protein [Candidatus Omnitrophica bacterium]|nr:HDIG domain-containing protein [Candidatus Omnitrophota bacterium]